MRKKSKYRPKPVLVNPLGYVLEGMTAVRAHETSGLDLKIKNHLALANLTKGNGTRSDVNTMIAMGNITEALHRMGFGTEYAGEIKAGINALYAVAMRGQGNNRFILRAEEMKALNTLCDLHDAQLEIITLKDMGRAVELVEKEHRSGKMRKVTKQPVLETA